MHIMARIRVVAGAHSARLALEEQYLAKIVIEANAQSWLTDKSYTNCDQWLEIKPEAISASTSARIGERTQWRFARSTITGISRRLHVCSQVKHTVSCVDR